MKLSRLHKEQESFITNGNNKIDINISSLHGRKSLLSIAELFQDFPDTNGP